jgi:Ca-activated chloride channel homolog
MTQGRWGRSRRASWLAGALFALPLPAFAQATAPPAPAASPTPRPFTLEVDVQVVSVTAVVHDKAGKFVPGLRLEDVEVYEDGRKQQLSYFQEASGPEAKIPLSVVLVLDASGSMDKTMHFLQEAALTFVHKLEEVDTALVVQFNESVKASVDFSDDIARLEQFVEALQAWGGTSLNDAVHYSLNRIKDQKGRKAVIVFSDGDDTTSSFKNQEVVDYARAVEATIYTVGIGSVNGGFLRKLADETGGSFFHASKVSELNKIFSGISDELHHHYALAYTPAKAPDGSFRTIEVRVPGRKDLQVRVRKGYFAVQRRRPPAR